MLLRRLPRTVKHHRFESLRTGNAEMLPDVKGDKSGATGSVLEEGEGNELRKDSLMQGG